LQAGQIEGAGTLTFSESASGCASGKSARLVGMRRLLSTRYPPQFKPPMYSMSHHCGQFVGLSWQLHRDQREETLLDLASLGIGPQAVCAAEIQTYIRMDIRQIGV
jgi:hypothetical protein